MSIERMIINQINVLIRSISIYRNLFKKKYHFAVWTPHKPNTNCTPTYKKNQHIRTAKLCGRSRNKKIIHTHIQREQSKVPPLSRTRRTWVSCSKSRWKKDGHRLIPNIFPTGIEIFAGAGTNEADTYFYVRGTRQTTTMNEKKKTRVL